jgi:hypothetical protein
MDETELATFQASLLEILSVESEPAEVLKMLERLPMDSAMAEYIATFDPRMVQVAADLVKRWGRRSAEHND